ncbi:MAG TPA: TRAP transporter substrate-binding protein [Microvirga sp.]|jgi:tripartite ATP-independent transporter DctP family solute receptor|nr:TRAP transporter substrate-binding protein [Microvirga sp.]
MTTGSAVPHRRSKRGLSPTRRAALLGGAAVAAAFVSRSPARAARVLRLGHALSAAHPVHQSMLNFAELVAHRTQDEVNIVVYADGHLGEEPNMIAQTMAGALDLTKASASVLDTVDPRYGIFNIPFLIRDKAHWRRIVTGPPGQAMLNSGAGTVVGLTFYDAGARSFYAKRSIQRPEDLRGLKIRVQPSPSTVRMIELLDAEPRPMPWINVYSALETGLIDGAENNLSALSFGRHAEVVKYYSLTEHTMVPDVLLMSRRVWDTLPENHRSVLRQAAAESAVLQSTLWEDSEGESRRTAERLGVTFEVPDKEPFARKLAPMKDEFGRRDGALRDFIAAVERT